MKTAGTNAILNIEGLKTLLSSLALRVLLFSPEAGLRLSGLR